MLAHVIDDIRWREGRVGGMLGVMEIIPFGPDDEELEAYVAVSNAVRALDSPWQPSLTRREAAGELRWGYECDPAQHFLARVDGVPVAAAAYSTSRYDNHHLAWLDVDVHPDHRRRGHGSELLAALVERARAEGRTTIGITGWESAAAAGFAGRHGLELGQSEIQRRQLPLELDREELERLREEALPHAAAYDLVRLAGPVPEEDLAAFSVMVAAINDAPTGDLDLEDEVYSPERVRAYETAQGQRGARLYRVFARHRESGELAGQTVVSVDGERPELAEQDDTSVVAAHRGHRLGLLLKLELLRWLRTDEPQVSTLDTWNAESNDQMIGVNEVLGYRVMGRLLSFQRRI